MVGFLLAAVCAAILVATLYAMRGLPGLSGLAKVVLAGFAVRLVLQLFIRDIPFFSHGLGGDCILYEDWARMISAMWKQTGIQYITADKLPELGATTLPENIFALVIHLNGGEASRTGCVAIVALAAALVAINVYSLAVRFGAQEKQALLFTAILYFQPAFLFYTSDMYKDGLVLCFAMGALGAAMRLGFKWSWRDLIIGLLCEWALWYVRFYLVFATVAALLVGIVGIGTKRLTRPIILAVLLAITLVVLGVSTDVLQTATERASVTFEHGTSAAVITSNSMGGSGVVFDDGGVPYRALLPKLAYTLFSPFPWAAGSLGFQVGKLDVLIWYFVLYRAYQSVRRVDRRVLLMIVSFVAPCTFMYATSMSNVGLIVRQRLVIVAATVVLAAVHTPEKKKRTARSSAQRFPGHVGAKPVTRKPSAAA